ncbi:hypothetical protein SNEBB_010604 [Seison nebaliae]|nr:hypothetical protein SNEBB_010604 [Seison nebaliae]
MTFDDNRPTSQSGGKAKVCGMLKDKFFFKNLFMVGDGMTDMEACPPADAFIGFGGNRVREGVKQKSLWYVTSFEELENNL